MNRSLARLEHLRRLTDPRGLLKRATGDCPDRSCGYDIIDNADALRLCALGSDRADAATFQGLAQTYFGMLTKGRMEDGQARHSCDAMGRWHTDGDNLLVQSRVARALAAVVVSELPINIRLAAASWWRALLPHAQEARTPASAGNWLVAIGQLRAADPGRDLSLMSSLADWLVEDCYYPIRSIGWEWFEDRWSPGSTVAATGLWYACLALGEHRYASVARTTTSFLIDNLFQDGMFVPVGTQAGWDHKAPRAIFDQEPRDACDMVELLKTAAEIGRMPLAEDHATIASEWFTGNNVSGQSLLCNDSGGCCSAIRQTGLDRDQHASALLAWLLTQAAIRATIHEPHPFNTYVREIFV